MPSAISRQARSKSRGPSRSLSAGFIARARLPASDIWIATVAARHGAVVLTFDEHFRAIARVGSTILAPHPRM